MPAQRRVEMPYFEVPRVRGLFQAADQAMQTHGGFGYAREYHVERYWREARIMKLAPISQEMIMNYVSEPEHVLAAMLAQPDGPKALLDRAGADTAALGVAMEVPDIQP